MIVTYVDLKPKKSNFNISAVILMQKGTGLLSNLNSWRKQSRCIPGKVLGATGDIAGAVAFLTNYNVG